jgi:alkaline phosphatase D
MNRKPARPELPRRKFLKHATLGGLAFTTGIGGILYSRRAPAVIAAASSRPSAAWGLQIGDVVGDRAIVWSRADKASRPIVEWSLDQSFSKSVTLRGPAALEASDFTARIDLTDLPSDEDVRRYVRSGGIDLSCGGMKIYEAMRQTQADFFIHSGDTIYADGPLTERVTDAGGITIWTNAYLDSFPRNERLPRPCASTTATISTTASTLTCSASPPRSRRSGSGTITR